MGELTRQLGKLKGMERSVPDPCVDSPQGRAMHAQIHAQAEHCLALLDKLVDGLPRLERDKNIATLAPIRSRLQEDILDSSVLVTLSSSVDDE